MSAEPHPRQPQTEAPHAGRTHPPLYSAAVRYVEVGLSVIPTDPRTKAPIIPWKDYQTRPPTAEELASWFITKRSRGLGIVCGAVSGRLEILDFDHNAALYKPWMDFVEDVAPGLTSRLVVQKTQNNGSHAAYHCPEGEIPGNTKIAQRGVDVSETVLGLLSERGVNPADEASIRKALPSVEVEVAGKKFIPRLANGKFIVVVTLIETRGEGGQFLANPTPGYELLQGSFTDLPEITPEERRILINAAVSLNEWVDPQKVESYGRRVPKGAEKPGDDFNERGDVSEILAKHKWEPVGARGAYQHFRRPGKDRGQSASLIDGKWLYVFSSNASPFEPEKTYSPFAVYALLECEGDFVKAAWELAQLGYGNNNFHPNPAAPKTSPPSANWGLAARLFPRTPFPWEVLPTDIADSLQQLARACATSPNPLPGAAFPMLSSILGRTLAVSPKTSWNAPLIVWHADIRHSGECKTPPPRLMAGTIHEAQKREAERYQKELDAYKKLTRKERDQEPPPPPPRGYFVSDLTLEGLREDLDNSPNGGIVVIQDEISAFISAQNQYKARGGTDREGWLALWDGNPARVKRVGKEVYINGARVSLFGGIQPKIFKTFFAGSNGLYLDDGTLYRFLMTCEPPTFYEATPESWEDRQRERWEGLLQRAMDWVNGEILAQGGRIEQPTRMVLDSQAQQKFLDWQNDLNSFKNRLPAQFRGFLPKAVEYCLRLTGIIHCMHKFSMGGTPQAVLTVEDLDRGIKAVTFYLGQVQAALQIIEDENFVPMEISERTILLARTLDRLRSHLGNGRLAIGYLQDEYNKIAPKTQHIGSARAMGAWLRGVRLTTTPELHDANGRRRVNCLEWNQKTEKFIDQSLHSLQPLQTLEWQGSDDGDIENPTSPSSPSLTEPVASMERLERLQNQPLRPETCTNSHNGDVGEVGEVGDEDAELEEKQMLEQARRLRELVV